MEAYLDGNGRLRLDGGRRGVNAKIIGDFTNDDGNGIATDFAPSQVQNNERVGHQIGDWLIAQDPAKAGVKTFGIVDAAGNVIATFTQGAPGVGGLAIVGSFSSTFGAGAAVVAEEGNISRQISAAGVQPGGTAVDSVLAVFSLPASSFDIAGRGITITAQGSFGATANNKRLKLIFNAATAVVGSAVTGGTAISDTGVVATNGGGWSLQANVFKYGAAGSNTQMGLHQQAQVGAAVAAMLAPSLITATESGAILIAVVGNATTAVSDIVFNFLEINAMN